MRVVEQLIHLTLRVAVAFFPRFAPTDDAYAARWLSPAEYALYLQMDARDRAHGVMVAKALQARCPSASPLLVRAALLHDVGKSLRPYRPLERILVHLCRPPQLPASPRLTGLAGALQQRLHHARYGAELIRAAGGHPRVAELVARHHQPAGDAEAQQLMRVEVRF